MDKRPISFLLGAGFSKPAGYPLASEINDRFVRLKESDISIHTDGSAWFNDGNSTPNDWFTRKKQRLFVERLLRHYCHEVVTPTSFHYEEFYDWYKDLLEDRTTNPAVEAIAKGVGHSLRQAMTNFDLAFNQLVCASLEGWLPEVHHGSGSPPSHASFLEMVGRLGQEHLLHFRSLNHDLFFESLSSSDAMQGELSDGFVELGSPFYGKLVEHVKGPNGGDFFSSRVRLPVFSGEFDSRFNLYKLHGSVDHYVFHDVERMTIKTKRGIGTHDFRREVGEGNELRYEPGFGNYHPDFLSGTTFKALQYESTAYYRRVFDCFKRNLESSDTLLCIGYGFGDEEINRFIIDHLLDREETRVLIVDIQKMSMPLEIERASQFFDRGVTDCDYNALFASILAGPILV